MKKIKLGFAPTRRSIFSAPDAVKYRGLTAQRLKELVTFHERNQPGGSQCRVFYRRAFRTDM